MKKRWLWLAIPIIALAAGVGIWSGNFISPETSTHADLPVAPGPAVTVATKEDDLDALIAERDRLMTRIEELKNARALKEGQWTISIRAQSTGRPAVVPAPPSIEEVRAQIAQEKAAIAWFEKEQQ